MANMELRLEFGLNTHSWVRICHGSNKFVMDSNNNDTEVPEDELEEQALQLNVKDILHTDPRETQNHKEGNLLVIHRVPFR